ncbi:TOG array regulator of axonemal microtubules protein 2-like [Periplaneta americana]|uniref:TOG array regulator of axonemal microtubules protein 2-like n=1 Tax=Periplaneta americana TaxID=6978 RepID=UPI0037E83B06
MVLSPDDKFPSITGNRRMKVYAKCPMCQGSGYCEQFYNPMVFNEIISALPEKNGNSFLSNGRLKNDKHIRRNTISDTGEPLKLPVLGTQNRRRQSIPKILLPEDSALRNNKVQEDNINKYNTNRNQSPVFGKLILPNVHINPNSTSASLNNEHRTTSGEGGGGGGREAEEEYLPGVKKDLLPRPREFENPQEAMKIAISNLKQSQWEIVLQAVHDIVQISRYNPPLLEPHMSLINRILCQLLKSLRSHVTRTACQAARELFRTMQNTQRPEFDEVVSSLLLRTADMNRFIRQDSNEALDSMVMYIPPYHSTRALVDKGASHKNPLVRTAAARLLTCVVIISGSETILSPTANKEIRRRVLSTAAKFLADGNLETRMYAKKLVKFLMEHEEFESIFYSEVDRSATRSIEKTLVSLRGQIKKRSVHSSREIR